ncbi:MAG: Hsp70 family protein [Myxococcota bacterium]
MVPAFYRSPYDHPDVQRLISRYPYKVVPGPGRKVAVEINGRIINLTAISAKILAYIREAAERSLQHPVQRAIITVPAYYNQNQRDAVVQAGRLAGLTVERIIYEQTAAAIAYGLTYSSPRKILVYDLGGGTFDVSIMSVVNKSLTVLSTAGDTFLGGEDFDIAIVHDVYRRYHEQTKVHLSQNHTALVMIKIAAEKAKKRLSQHDRSMITTRNAMLMDGSTARIEMELTRKQLEALVEPFVSRTFKICEMALQGARLSKSDIDDVILVGGQTLMPYVRQRTADYFQKEPRVDLRADEVVALGAGMLTSMDQQGQAELRDVVPISIGVGLGGGRFKKLIERNTPVPCSKSVTLNVPARNLPGHTIEIYQGEAPELSRNEHLGSLSLAGMTPGPQDPVPLRVDFLLSPDCLLKAKVVNLATEEELDVLFETQRSL